jgi:type I restriction enzyme M protein
VVWLYRGQHDRFEALVAQHIHKAMRATSACWLDEDSEPRCEPLDNFARDYRALRQLMQPFVSLLPERTEHDAVIGEYLAVDTDPLGPIEGFRRATDDLHGSASRHDDSLADSGGFLRDSLTPFAERARGLGAQLDTGTRATLRLLDLAEKDLAARDSELWPGREIGRARKALEASRNEAVERLKQVRHFQRHAAWLLERFPEGRYGDVQGLCKAVTRAEIEAADWSLTPGRYVGVAAVEEDEDFDFADALGAVYDELKALNAQACALATRLETSLAGLLA